MDQHSVDLDGSLVVIRRACLLSEQRSIPETLAETGEVKMEDRVD